MYALEWFGTSPILKCIDEMQIGSFKNTSNHFSMSQQKLGRAIVCGPSSVSMLEYW